jgi:hypothetical protein
VKLLSFSNLYIIIGALMGYLTGFGVMRVQISPEMKAGKRKLAANGK